MVFFSSPSCHCNGQVILTLYLLSSSYCFFSWKTPSPLLAHPSYKDRKTSDRFHFQFLSFQSDFRVGCFMFSVFLPLLQRERNIHLKVTHWQHHSCNLWTVKGKAKSSPYWLQSLNNDRKSFRKIWICHCALR